MSDKQPPKTLWQAIELALHDEALVHKDKRYKVDMDFLHDPYSGKCMVCFAGGVMAKTLGADRRDHYAWDFGAEWKRVFLALDYVRTGNVIDALDVFYPDDPGYDVPDSLVADYAKDRAQWRRDMHKIKRQLKARGL